MTLLLRDGNTKRSAFRRFHGNTPSLWRAILADCFPKGTRYAHWAEYQSALITNRIVDLSWCEESPLFTTIGFNQLPVGKGEFSGGTVDTSSNADFRDLRACRDTTLNSLRARRLQDGNE